MIHPWLEYHVINKEGKMFCLVCRRYDCSSSFCVGSTNFKLNIWLHKRMPYFSDNRSRLRREEDDGPAEIPGDHVLKHSRKYRQLSLVHLMMPKMMMSQIIVNVN